jgi:hypothetical protein
MIEPDDQFGEWTIGDGLALLLDPYDELEHLECDGFSRVASYVLARGRVPHRRYAGRCTVGRRLICPHFWIEIRTDEPWGGDRIDYRLGMWAGEATPHGVFPLDRPGPCTRESPWS